MLAIADRHREEVSATELLNTVEGANRAFANVAELLLEVQMNWYQCLSGQVTAPSASAPKTWKLS